MYSKALSKSAIAALAALALIPATAGIANAKVCKNYSISKSGDKKWTNLSARVSARWHWHRHVKANKGFVWSTYMMASSKGYDCHRVRAKWRCAAYGRPCRAGN